MDKQQEHDLRDNDLLYGLTHLKDWHERHRETINLVLIGILLVLLVFSVIRWMNAREEIARNSAWADLATATSPAAFAAIAETRRDRPVVAAMALLNAGDLLLEEASWSAAQDAEDGPEGEAAPGEAPGGDADAEAGTPMEAGSEASGNGGGGETGETPSEMLKRAVAFYERARAFEEAPLLIRLNAGFGLGAAHAGLGNLEAAREALTWMAAQAEADYPALAARAEARLDLLAGADRPLVFAEPDEVPAAAPEGLELPGPEPPAVPLAPAPAPEEAPGEARGEAGEPVEP